MLLATHDCAAESLARAGTSSFSTVTVVAMLLPAKMWRMLGLVSEILTRSMASEIRAEILMHVISDLGF
ncbi:hypothetical protein ACFX1S_003543 [Malus domestica]